MTPDNKEGATEGASKVSLSEWGVMVEAMVRAPDRATAWKLVRAALAKLQKYDDEYEDDEVRWAEAAYSVSFIAKVEP